MPSPHSAVCFLDRDGDAARGSTEEVYLQIKGCTAGTAAGDVRLTVSAGFPGGTIMTGGHDDAGRTTTPLAATYAYADLDGNGLYSPSDSIYLHRGALPGAVAPGDIALSGDAPFTTVGAGDPDVGFPVVAASVSIGGESFAEVDGNVGYSTGDLVFLDFDGDAQTTIGDLRLARPSPSATVSPTPSASSSQSGSHEPGSTTGSSANLGSSSNRSNGSSAEGLSSGGGKGAPLSLAVPLSALAFALRRRSSSGP